MLLLQEYIERLYKNTKDATANKYQKITLKRTNEVSMHAVEIFVTNSSNFDFHQHCITTYV